MSMKTPSEIAFEKLPEYIGDSDTSDGFDRDDMRAFAVAAIEADRAQHDLTYALSIIDRHDARAVIWSREDAEMVLDEMIEDGETEQPTPDEYRAIIDRAVQSRYWRSLNDCMEGDWDAIREAIREALSERELAQ